MRFKYKIQRNGDIYQAVQRSSFANIVIDRNARGTILACDSSESDQYNQTLHSRNDDISGNKSFISFEKKKYQDANSSFLQTTQKIDKEKYNEDCEFVKLSSEYQSILKPLEVVSKEDFQNKRNLFEVGNRKKGKSIRKRKGSSIHKTRKTIIHSDITENVIVIPILEDEKKKPCAQEVIQIIPQMKVATEVTVELIGTHKSQVVKKRSYHITHSEDSIIDYSQSVLGDINIFVKEKPRVVRKVNPEDFIAQIPKNEVLAITKENHGGHFIYSTVAQGFFDKEKPTDQEIHYNTCKKLTENKKPEQKPKELNEGESVTDINNYISEPPSNMKMQITLPTSSKTSGDILNNINLKGKFTEKDKFHQFVVLQKQLKFKAYNLELQRKSQVSDPKEVIYANVADYPTINQLLLATKKASEFQLTQLKKSMRLMDGGTMKKDKRTISDREDSNKNKNKKRAAYPKQPSYNQIPKVKNEKKNENKLAEDTIENTSLRDDMALMKLLEEIKQRSDEMEKHFKEIENEMKLKIKELNDIILHYQENERRYIQEIDSMKRKLGENFVHQNSEGMNKNNNVFNSTKSSEDKSPLPNGKNYVEDTENANIMHTPERRPSKIQINLSSLDDLGKFSSEEKFTKINQIIQIRSFLLLLKDFGLEKEIFYDQANIREFLDDVCEECFTSEDIIQYHTCSQGKWNYHTAFSLYPKLKTFIGFLAKRLIHENKTRLKIEEKTLKIFSNDLKAINQLDQKLKKLEIKNRIRTSSSIKSGDFITRDELDS